MIILIINVKSYNDHVISPIEVFRVHAKENFVLYAQGLRLSMYNFDNFESWYSTVYIQYKLQNYSWNINNIILLWYQLLILYLSLRLLVSAWDCQINKNQIRCFTVLKLPTFSRYQTKENHIKNPLYYVCECFYESTPFLICFVVCLHHLEQKNPWLGDCSKLF